jgi:hypothetical protein
MPISEHIEQLRLIKLSLKETKASIERSMDACVRSQWLLDKIESENKLREPQKETASAGGRP